MRFDQSFLDEIRARLPVSQVVARRVKLKRQGREFIGLSPFKQEKTPSFTVNDHKGFYHCFASGEHGDIFKFLQVTEGLSFPESVERLASEAGLPMPVVSPGEEQRERGRDRLRDAMEAACSYFEAQLADVSGRDARDYLRGRGLTDETRAAFRLGFGGRDRHGLKQHLADKGFSAEEMSEAGLIISGEDIPVAYDRFHGRLIFPIRDTRNRVIAFGGRALSDAMKAKYVNSPETPLFHKGYVLFNAAAARQAAFDLEQVIAVEGYMDVIALAQAGFANAVAPLGTALTEDQIKLLWRMSDEPVLCFDGDEAGRKAAYRALDTALSMLEAGRSLKFVFLPQGQDPDDLVREQGSGAFREVLGKAQPLVGVLWAREVEGGDFSTPERRAALERRLHDLLAQISDKRVRRHYGQEIAKRLETLWQGGARNQARRTNARDQFSPARRRDRGGRAKTPMEPWVYGGASEALKKSALAGGSVGFAPREVLILRTLLNHTWLLEERAEEIASLTLQDRRLTLLRDEMLKLISGDKALDSSALNTHLKHSECGDILAQVERAITHKSDWFAEAGAARSDVDTGWRNILALHRRSVELERELEAAQRAFDAEQSEQAESTLLDIRRQLFELDGIEASVDGYGEGSEGVSRRAV